MDESLSRMLPLIGEPAAERLCRARVAVVGLGGVGSACAEALVRCGIGTLIAVDHDTVDITNLNRQLFATTLTTGLPKTQAAAERLLAIRPHLELIPLPLFYQPESREALFSLSPDVVVDAIDTLSAKLDLAEQCQARGIPLISCLGTGNRLDPTKFQLGRIEDTAGCGCPLARVMRRECRKRGIEKLPVLYSTEMPQSVLASSEHGRHAPASISFCPPVAGYIMAGWVVRRIAQL